VRPDGLRRRHDDMSTYDWPPTSTPRRTVTASLRNPHVRTIVPTVDFSNALAKIHINNWNEVNELWFVEYSGGYCTPIDRTLGVEFTVDHEEMDSGAWSLAYQLQCLCSR
jgi:hypothetical protein